MADQYTKQDPTTAYPMPDREGQSEIEHPGLTSDMVSAPDHGEKTYRGAGGWKGGRLSSPEVIRVSGERSQLRSRARVPMC